MVLLTKFRGIKSQKLSYNQSMNRFWLVLIANFLCVLPATLQAAQWAYVTNEKAVIYADQQMTSPIGYVTKGNKVRIGEVSRNKGRVYPIIVNGRIAWIAEQDIQTNKRLAGLEGAMNRIRQRNQETLNRFLTIDYITGAKQWSVTSESSLLESTSRNFTGFVAKGNYYNTLRNDFFVRANMEYLSSSDELDGNLQTFDILSFQADAVYKVFKALKMGLNLYAGGSVIPYARLELQDFYVTRGYGVGVQGGADFSYYMNKRLAFNADFNISYQYILGMKIPSPIDESFNSSLIGSYFGLGITYLY
jgi:hypothetical protein